MTIALLVGIGGFIGAVMRYFTGVLAFNLWGGTGFPAGTFIVNLVGCLLIGAIAGLAESRQMIGPEARAFVMVGLLGGFTTFSAFGLDTLILVRNGHAVLGFLNVVGQVSLGLAAVWIAYVVAQRV